MVKAVKVMAMNPIIQMVETTRSLVRDVAIRDVVLFN